MFARTRVYVYMFSNVYANNSMYNMKNEMRRKK